MVHGSFSFFSLLNLFILFGASRAKIPAIIVFGDSTVDPGNNNFIPTIVKSNFPPYGRDFYHGKPTGRFCNGRLVIDFLAEGFGIKPYVPAYLDPAYGIKDFATGVSFASAGTGYDNLTSFTVSVIPMWKELEYFKLFKRDLVTFMGENNAKKRLNDALFMISLGTNDFILNYYLLPAGRKIHYTVDEYSDYLIHIAEKFVLEIYRLGARKISLVGLPPVGCLPLIRSINGGACREDCNNLARRFDEKLKVVIAKLSKELNGIKLLFTDVFTPALHVINNAQAYGFDSVGVACCGTGTIELSYLCNANNPLTCIDASKYVFWDSVHPTEKLYHIVASHLLKTTLAEFL
ncbi:hypothetical protein ACHQM5_010718 [Ranunculus cassubicifolius]